MIFLAAYLPLGGYMDFLKFGLRVYTPENTEDKNTARRGFKNGFSE